MRTATLCLALCALAACSVQTTPVLPDAEVQRLAALEYPAAGEWGGDLDIVVLHHGDRLQLVNRTPRSYANVTLWLNQQYARPVERIDIGTDNFIDLRTAINTHGQSYPVGSFLKPEKRTLLVQAELLDPATNLRHRLTVQPQRDPARR